MATSLTVLVFSLFINLERQRELRAFQSQLALNALFETALTELSIEEQLSAALEIITTVPWVALENKGSIFLLDRNKQVLEMKASKNIPQLETLCNNVKIGQCLCGRAAALKRIVFANHFDGVQHTTTFVGMKPHGHYCVPILTQVATYQATKTA